MGDTKLLKEMGERIFKRRKALKMTQDELSEMIGVSTQMISNLETGKKAIRPENLLKICNALNISADYVLSGSPAKGAVDNIAEKLAHLTPEELQIVNGLIDYMNRAK